MGSMLFKRCVSGTRVVTGHGLPVSTIGPHRFVGFGSHADDYPHSYLTAAAAVGVSKADVDLFAKRLDGALTEYYQKQQKKKKQSKHSQAEQGPEREGEGQLHENATQQKATTTSQSEAVGETGRPTGAAVAAAADDDDDDDDDADDDKAAAAAVAVEADAGGGDGQSSS